MATITNGTVEYGRVRPVADYSNRTPRLTWSYTLGPEEDAVAVATRFMAQLATIVHTAAGEAVPAHFLLPAVIEKPVQAKQPPKPAVEIVGGDHAMHDEPMAEPSTGDEPKPVTDAVLKTAFSKARERGVDGPRITKLVEEHTGAPGMKSFSLDITDPRRQAILDAVQALHRE